MDETVAFLREGLDAEYFALFSLVGELQLVDFMRDNSVIKK
jgi:hypothetical protein